MFLSVNPTTISIGLRELMALDGRLVSLEAIPMVKTKLDAQIVLIKAGCGLQRVGGKRWAKGNMPRIIHMT